MGAGEDRATMRAMIWERGEGGVWVLYWVVLVSLWTAVGWRWMENGWSGGCDDGAARRSFRGGEVDGGCRQFGCRYRWRWTWWWEDQWGRKWGDGAGD